MARRPGRRRWPSRPCRTPPARRPARAAGSRRPRRATARRRSGAAGPGCRRACSRGDTLAPGSMRASAATTAPSPITRRRRPARRARCGRRADPHALGQHALAQHAVGAHHHTVVQHRALHASCRCPPSSWAPSTDCGPMCAPAVRQPSPISEPVSSRGGRSDSGVPAEQVPGGLEVALGRADVHPVAARPGSRRGPLPTSAGNTSRSNETFAPGGHQLLDHLALDHVGAGVDAVGGRRAVGLLEEVLDLALVARGHHAVAGGVLDLDQRQRGARALLGVPGQLRRSGPCR